MQYTSEQFKFIMANSRAALVAEAYIDDEKDVKATEYKVFGTISDVSNLLGSLMADIIREYVSTFIPEHSKEKDFPSKFASAFISETIDNTVASLSNSKVSHEYVKKGVVKKHG